MIFTKFPLLIALLFIQVSSYAQVIENQLFYMQGNECKTFTTKGNSKIIVPSNCFTLDGKPYSGDITIQFKEYKDQMDFVLGGLDLRYEVNGNKRTLQSGGMFDINIITTSTPERQLGFAKTKKITIKFAIDPRFNVAGLEPYFYNPQSKKWIKETRFGLAPKSNRSISDNQEDLWQDDPNTLVSKKDFADGDDWEGDCYTIQVQDRNDPNQFIDSIICPVGQNNLDYKYTNFKNEQAFKTMQIDKMGLFNYDKILKDDNKIPLMVKLLDSKGNPLNLEGKLYVVYKQSNTVIYYFQDDLEKDFALIPRNDIHIFTIDSDGNIWKVPDAFWQKTNLVSFRDKKIELPFNFTKMAYLTKEEYAAATGLKN